MQRMHWGLQEITEELSFVESEQEVIRNHGKRISTCVHDCIVYEECTVWKKSDVINAGS